MAEEPKLMTEAEFNAAVKAWASGVRMSSSRNLDSMVKHDEKDWKNRTSKHLKQSLSASFKVNTGIVQRIRFQFERHGVFLHYGVGRGYVRVGNSIVRGRRLQEFEHARMMQKGYQKKELKNYKVLEKNSSGQVERKPVDWIDVEIRTGLKTLANVAQEFYGDVAMKRILDQMDKATITKKKNG